MTVRKGGKAAKDGKRLRSFLTVGCFDLNFVLAGRASAITESPRGNSRTGGFL